MALKGNLLFNGDFETGTTEGWNLNPEGFSNNYDLVIETNEILGGNYGGNLLSSKPYAVGWICYEHLANFEEYDAYLLIFPVKIEKGDYLYQMVFGYDDKGALRGLLYLGYNDIVGEWKRGQAILRGYADITHFKIGLFMRGESDGGQFYIDEVKLIPLKQPASHTLAETVEISNLTITKTFYLPLGCIGRCKIESVVKVKSVSGTDPTLKPYVITGLLPDGQTSLTIEHKLFTEEGRERKYFELPEVSFVEIIYNVGGDNPSFSLRHDIRIYPLQ